MPTIVTPLNAKQIDCVSPRDKDFTLPDGNGLHLLIKVNGNKLWEYVYTSPTLYKRRHTSFGSYPKVKLAEARMKREKCIELIKIGIDPIEDKKLKKLAYLQENELKKKYDIYTIEFVAEEYFSTKQNNKNLKDITVKKSMSRLKEHFFMYLPKKEKTTIFEIELETIINCLNRLDEANKLETLGRLRMLIIGLFDFAYSNEILIDSIISDKLKLRSFKIAHKSNVKNNPTITNEFDVKNLYNGIVNYKFSYLAKYALLLSIHTAQRQGSIISAEWEEIDFETNLWTIPASKMKMHREHQVPLSIIMVKYLKELYELKNNTSSYLFPNSQHLGKHMSENTVNQAIRRIGFTKEQQTAHGLRALFKTICKENQEKHNLPNEYVERILSHKIGTDVENAYLRAMPLNEMRRLLDWWSCYLEATK